MSGPVGKKAAEELERQQERCLRLICKLFATRGIVVRRENLSRGSSYRVKSGGCVLTGDNLLFIDRRLPCEQQFSMLADFADTTGMTFTEDEVISMLPQFKSQLKLGDAVAIVESSEGVSAEASLVL
ncbi:MAG: hypothetical protein PHC51_07545 [bacterium]|nr:hypothetical protein [bacterium]